MQTRVFARRLGILFAILSIASLVSGCGGADARRASHVERGKAYFEQGDFAKANVEFRNALQIVPKNVEARIWAGRTAEHLGRLRDAAGLYQSVIDSNPDNADARAELGRLYALAGRTDNALKLVAPALVKHPDDSELLTVRALARSRSGDAAGAIADAERATQLDAANDNAVALLAALYRGRGDGARAETLLTGAVQRRPASVDLRLVLIDLYLDSDAPEKAEAQLRALIAQKPAELHYREDLAQLYARAHRPDEAQRVLQEAVSALPKSDDAKIVLADFLATQRGRAEGEKMLRSSIAAAPGDYRLRLGLAALLEHAGATNDAIDVYDEVRRRDSDGPNGIVARDRMAHLYLAQGRERDAERLIGEAIARNPRDNDALAMRGDFELRHGDAAAAISDLRALLRDRPNSAQIRRLLARALVVNGQPALAEDELRQAIQAEPAAAGARLDLAQLLVNSRRPDQAVQVLEEGVRAAPENGGLRQALVQAYIAKRDYKSAQATADDLAALQPRSGGGAYLSGLVAQAQGRLDDSEREFESALALQPNAVSPLIDLTRLQISRGEASHAAARLQESVRHDSKNGLSLELLGEVYLSTKSYREAIDVLTRAEAAAPKLWYVYRNLAMAKAGAGDDAGAVVAYKAGIAAVPDEPQLVAELASYDVRKGRIDDAIALYDSLYRHNPASEAAASNLAMLLATYRSDRPSLDRAWDLSSSFASSDDGALLDANGWVQLKRGDVHDALPVLERAVAREPRSSLAHYHLAIAELQAGERDRARQDLKTALSGATFPGAEDARSVLASLAPQATG